jgi:hypothetical protein
MHHTCMLYLSPAYVREPQQVRKENQDVHRAKLKTASRRSHFLFKPHLVLTFYSF